ncbi:MAG: hypothetical protein KDC35_10250 [Acidobacteria bacterium]|nr:hypothetical protein [Acidobacteriota bacterium]
MKATRSFHAYLGCFLVPMILLYCVTGIFQLWDIAPLDFTVTLSTWHTQRALKQGLSFVGPMVKITATLFTVLLMMLSTTGVFVALKTKTHRRYALMALALGLATPITVILPFVQ